MSDRDISPVEDELAYYQERLEEAERLLDEACEYVHNDVKDFALPTDDRNAARELYNDIREFLR